MFKSASAGDSPEFKGLSAFLNARANSAAGAKLYVDFHAYGLYFMGRECHPLATKISANLDISLWVLMHRKCRGQD